MARSRQSEKQAGAIAFWNEKICLVSSRGGRRWTIPKGCLEKGMRQWEVAAMEAWEEAGLEGRIHTRPFGKYRYSKGGRPWEVDLYFMEVTSAHRNWPEDNRRKRKWIDPLAIDLWVTHPEVCQAVKSVFTRNSSTNGGNRS